MKLNDLTKAEEQYRMSLAIDNLFSPAKTNLAILLYREGKTGPAEKLFRELLVFDPDLTDGYYYLALLYGEQKKYGEAISLLETAVTKPGVHSRIWYNLGLLYQMAGKDDLCVSSLQKGLISEPCNYDLLYALFAFYMNRNDAGKAEPVIVKMVSCYPDEKQIKDLYNSFLQRK